MTLRLIERSREFVTALALADPAMAVAVLLVGVANSVMMLATGKIADGDLILRGNCGLQHPSKYFYSFWR